MLTERTTTLFVSIFYFQKCQTRDYTRCGDCSQLYFVCIKVNNMSTRYPESQDGPFV